MITPDKKLEQCKRMSEVTAELVGVVVDKTENRTEAQVALQGALEIVKVFSCSAGESVQENS